MARTSDRFNKIGIGVNSNVCILGPDKVAADLGTHYMVPQSNRHVEIFDDFIQPTFSTTEGVGVWKATVDSGGVISVSPAAGGHVVMTTDGTDDDDLQLHSADEWFSFSATKDLAYEVRAKCDNTNVSLFYGLAETPIVAGDANATLLAESLCGFHMNEAASILFTTCDDTTPTTTDTGVDAVADTFVTLGFTYTAADTTWRAYVNGELKVTSTATTNPASEMGLVLSMRNGDASANITTIDYVYCSAEM